MTTLRLLPDLEQALTQIQGVRAASVVTGPDARPTEIHVLAGAGKPAKQLVRDVQSLAMAKYDLDIDHRIVSVVQLDAEDLSVVTTSPTGGNEAPRPVMTTVQLRTTNGETEATVAVAMGEHTFQGSANGPGSANARPRLVARATLEAVRELLGAPAEVEHAAVAHVGSHTVAVCVVALVVPRVGEQLLTGSALVRDDEADAVARCVLDALNRRLSG